SERAVRRRPRLGAEAPRRAARHRRQRRARAVDRSARHRLRRHRHVSRRRVAGDGRARHRIGSGATAMTDWRSTPAPSGPSPWTFPAAKTWPDDDLVAMGADLEPTTLVAAYRHGLFPMGLPAATPVMGWWSPDPRGI